MAMITRTVKPTKAQAERVHQAVCAKYGFKPGDPHAPQLVMDFDWFGHGGRPSIVWEGGPYEWAVDCSFTLLETNPIPGIWYEAATSWALSIYRDITR